MTTNTLGKIVVGLVLTGTAAVSGKHFLNKSSEKINDQDDDFEYCLSADSSDEDWKLAQEHLKDFSKENIQIKSPDFLTLKNDLTNSPDSSGDTKGSRLKARCLDWYGNKNSPKIFELKKNKPLLKEIKYFCSLIIETKIGSKNLLDKNDSSEIWKSLQDKVKKNRSKKEETDKFVSSFHTLSSTIPSTDNDNSRDGKLIKNHCLSSYSRYYLNDNFTKRLIDNIWNYCRWTIGEQLIKKEEEQTDVTKRKQLFSEHKETTEDPDKSTFENEAKNMNSYDENTHGTLEDEKLKAIKDENVEATRKNKWKDIKDWCLSAYSFLYKTDNDNNYKIAKKLCLKEPSAAAAKAA